MVRRVGFRLPLYALLFLSLILALAGSAPSAAYAQARGQIVGVVTDEGGGVVPGARITVTDAKGVVVHTRTSDTTGRFAIPGVAPGTYDVFVQLRGFAPRVERVTVAASAPAPPLQLVLQAAGFAEAVVVTAQRIESRISETPRKIEVVDATDIERSVAADVTDVLKKNAGVDVVQYTGALSGIGLRGFRPQFSGINKRSLLLIDGRPSGVTNLATLLLDDVDRIEVLKGAASAVYGSSAMGGVVNVITRQSRGRIGGSLRLGAGSFGATDAGGRAGGALSTRVDFDVSGSVFDQRDDIRMGNGVTRAATGFKRYSGTGRIGADFDGGWRLEGRAEVYRGRDINSPPDIVAGDVGQSRKNVERNGSDVRLTGRLGAHALSVSTYFATEASHSFNVTTSNAADLPFLPYLSFENDLRWAGAQLRDAWAWSSSNVVVLGIDYERVTSVSHSFARTGDETAPFSANSNKRTVGLYGENNWKLADGRTVLTVGARIDRITAETVATPLKTNFTPSETSFNVLNPSLGVTHALFGGMRAHVAIGRAFIPAEASMLTGFTTTTVGGRTQISQGNPDLKPERSTSFDVGAEWNSSSARADVTFFRTVVKDRFISNILVSNPPPPDPIIVSIANGLDAHISGLDLEGETRISRRVAVFGNATHYFNRKERLVSGAEQDILNVARTTLRAGVDLDYGKVSARVSARYVRGRQDNDFNQPGFPIIDYENFTVADASVTYRLARRHSILLGINNVFDAFYYEKIGYPLQGASFKLSYRLGF